MKFSKTSLALLLIQLALVSTIAAKYLYQRWTCPRVWTRSAGYDSSLPMRGRYLSLRVTADGCQSTLPSAKRATFPRNADGTTRPSGYSVNGTSPVSFAANLKVEDNKLLAIRIEDAEKRSRGQWVEAWPGASCEDLELANPVDFYLPECAANPLPQKPGQELWIEVTVPPTGPPRPLQLALKDGAAWRPLVFQ